MLEVQKEVGTKTVHPLLGNDLAGLVLMLENDDGSMDRTGMEFGARRDRVVPGLETGDSRNDDIEWNIPLGRVLGVGELRNVISGCQLENFAQLEATLGDDGVVFVLVLVELPHEGLSLGGGSEPGQRAENLTTSDSIDINVVPEDGGVGCGDREGNLGKSRVKGLDSDHGILLIVKAESAEQTLDLQIRIDGPNTQVVAMLVGDSRAFRVKLDVDTVAVGVRFEQLASDTDGRSVGILCVVNALGLGKGAGRVFTCGDTRMGNGIVSEPQYAGELPCGKRTEVNLFRGMGIQLRNDKVSGIAALAFFDAHSGRECLPHTVLPLQVVFLHALVVVTLAAFADAGSTHLGERSVDTTANNVVVLVGLVTQTKDDVLEAGEVSAAVGEFE